MALRREEDITGLDVEMEDAKLVQRAEARDLVKITDKQGHHGGIEHPRGD